MAITATNKQPIQDSFAIIETGGKQKIVSKGEILDVELLGEHTEGDTITFDRVLLSDDGSDTTIGTPYTGGKVTAKYLGVAKGKKLNIVRFKSKSNYDRRVGHRQKYARVQIESIN